MWHIMRVYSKFLTTKVLTNLYAASVALYLEHTGRGTSVLTESGVYQLNYILKFDWNQIQVLFHKAIISDSDTFWKKFCFMDNTTFAWDNFSYFNQAPKVFLLV